MVALSNLCLIPSTLCVGTGSRLLSVTQELHPKSFILLADGQSLFQIAYLRGAQLSCVSHLITLAKREFFLKTKDEFPSVNATKASTSNILESFGQKHRLTNPGATPCVMIEVQSGGHGGEDAYGRIE